MHLEIGVRVWYNVGMMTYVDDRRDTMAEIKIIDELKGIYGKAVNAGVRTGDADLSEVPEPLHGSYNAYMSLETPFGEIYELGDNDRLTDDGMSDDNGEWLIFGSDPYGIVYRLCRYSPDEDGNSFTTFDHDAEDPIDGAVWKTLDDMLEELSNDHMDDDLENGSIVTISGDVSKGMKELMTVKKAFSSPLSIVEIKKKTEKGKCVIREGLNYYKAQKILAELELEHIKVKITKRSSW